MGSNWTATPYDAGVLTPWEAFQDAFTPHRVYLAARRLANPNVIVTNLRKASTNDYWVYVTSPTPGVPYGFTGLSIPPGITKFPWGETVQPP